MTNGITPSFDAQEVALLLMAVQRYKQLQIQKIRENDYDESERNKRYERIDGLDSLEEKLFDWLDKLENLS